MTVQVMQVDAPSWETLVFDGIDDVDVVKVTVAFGTVDIVARGHGTGATCPDCGHHSERTRFLPAQTAGPSTRRAARGDPAEGAALRLWSKHTGRAMVL